MSPGKKDNSKNKIWAKEAAIQIGAGGSAGFVEVCTLHPMDLVKTRFQLQVKTKVLDHIYYTGIWDCFKKMYKREGFLAYWKGIVPPILVETPKRALKFFTFEQYKELFFLGTSQPIPLTFLCAGLCAGMTEGFLVNPFEVIKVRLQSNQQHMKYSPSTITVTKKLIQEGGFGIDGLNKGLTATLMRNSVFNGVYFGFYHSTKSYLPQNKDSTIDFLQKIVMGFFSGSFASCLNIPFDVAKSRMQGPDSHKYKGTLKTISIIYKKEGFRALYTGLLPKVLRLGPGGAIMLVVYDYMHEYLEAVMYI